MVFKMKKYLFVLSTFVLLVFSSCKKFAGDPVTKDFNISGAYTALEVSNAFNVTVSDAVDVVTVTVGEKVMPYVMVEVVDNTLKIYVKPMGNIYGAEMKAIIPDNADLTSVDLSGASKFHSSYGLYGEKVEVELSGASDFYCDIDAVDVDVELSGASNFYGDIVAEEIDMSLSGASDIEGQVAAEDLDLDMSGASDATFEGQVTKLYMNLAGSSNIIKKVVDGRYALVCDQCEGFMSGASGAYIHCDGTIKVDLSGASDLHFTGEGNPADSSTSGGSSITHVANP